jgi:glycosyltransferase involved in cell wall biosynthesis
VHHPLPTITQGNPFRYVYRPGPLLAVLRRFRPDVVHVEQEPESLSLLQLSFLKPLFGYRLVFVAWENVNPLRLGIAFRAINYAVADAGIFGNAAALERARRLGYRGPAAILAQYGFEVAPGGLRPMTPGRLRVGYAGRLVDAKGVLDLLEAVEGFPGAELVLSGDGQLRERLLASPRVRWLGNMDRTEMASFWHDIDVLAVPSRTTREWAEQFGRVVVEAMANHVPVVGSSSGAIPEVIADAGLVVPEGDPAALRSALSRVALEPGLRARLVEAGVQRVRDAYSHEVVTRETVAFHASVASGRGRRVRA